MYALVFPARPLIGQLQGLLQPQQVPCRPNPASWLTVCCPHSSQFKDHATDLQNCFPKKEQASILEPSTNQIRYQILPSCKRGLMYLHRRQFRHFYPCAIPDLEPCRRRQLCPFVARLLLLHRDFRHPDHAPISHPYINAYTQGLGSATSAARHEQKMYAVLLGPNGRFVLQDRAKPRNFCRRFQFL